MEYILEIIVGVLIAIILAIIFYYFRTLNIQLSKLPVIEQLLIKMSEENKHREKEINNKFEQHEDDIEYLKFKIDKVKKNFESRLEEIEKQMLVVKIKKEMDEQKEE